MYFINLLLICFFRQIFCQTTDLSPHTTEDPVHIYTDGMDPNMRLFVTGETSIELAYSSDNKKAAQNIAAKMNNKFGRGWVCSFGSNGTGINLDYVNNTYIYFRVRTTEVVIFRLIQPTVNDLIIDARKAITDIKPEVSPLISREITIKITEVVKIAIITIDDDFKKISTYIKTEIDQKFGGDWIVICGDSSSVSSVDNINITQTIIINIVEVRIIITKGKENNCKIGFNSYIEDSLKAMNAIKNVTATQIINNNVGEYIKFMTKTDNSNIGLPVLNIINDTLHKDYSICDNCFKDIEYKLLSALHSNSYTSPLGFWVVDVDTHDSRREFNLQTIRYQNHFLVNIKNMFFTIKNIKM